MTPPEGLVHAIGHLVRRLVLPSAKDPPTRFGQTGVGVAVSSDVALEFCAPVRRVGPRCGAMFRAAVPEAAVDEHSELLADENDVGLRPSPMGQSDRQALAEAAAALVEDRSDDSL